MTIGHRADHRHPAAVRLGRRLVDDLATSPAIGDPPGDPRPRRTAARMSAQGSPRRCAARGRAARARRASAPRGGRSRSRGARELVPLLARELRAGGDASAVREGGRLERAAALVWIGAARRGRAARRVARDGSRSSASPRARACPYVLDTTSSRVAPGRGAPGRGDRAALARVLGPAGAGLAARLPVLREAVVDAADPRRARARTA